MSMRIRGRAAAFRLAAPCISGLSVALAAAGAAHAAGFYLQEQSVKGVGRAFSGEAADTGPESLWWNPASIADLTQTSAYLGFSGVLPSGDVKDTGSLIVRPEQAPAGVGGDPVANGPIKSGVIPSGAVAIPLGDKWAIGLAITSPFSFTTKYAPNSWTRYSALTTHLTTIDLQPSIAFAPTPWLRLGVAANAEKSNAELSNALPNVSPLLPDGDETLTGNGWNWGWSAGVQAHTDVVTVGLSYKSSIDHQLNGQAVVSGLLGPAAGGNGAVSTSASFRTPWQLIFGARFKVTPALTLNAQAVRAGWSEFNAIQIGAPVNQALPEGYKDTWTFALGADYAVCPRWTLRGGVQYDQTPTQNGARDARVPDADRVDLAVGASFEANKAVTIDAGLSYDLFQNASIDRPTAAFVGTPLQTPVLTSGELTGAHALILALGGRFRF